MRVKRLWMLRYIQTHMKLIRASLNRDHSGCHSCSWTENWGYNSHKFTKTGQQKIGKMLGDESQFPLQRSDGWQSINPSCLIITVQCGVMVWGIFFGCLGLLVLTKYCLHAAACLSIVVDHVHQIMTTEFSYKVKGYEEASIKAFFFFF